MSDQFTTVSSEGYFQRLGGSLVGMLVGLLLLPAAIGVLYWNEGRAVVAASALSRGAAATIEASATHVDPASDGKLVHLTGEMQAATPARDPLFGVTQDGLLRLSRNAEMYQWKETTSTHSQDSIGGTKTTETTYSYARAWSRQPINSAEFKHPEGHENPQQTVASATFDGGGVTLGAYRIDPSLLAKVSNFTALQPAVPPPADYKSAGDGFYRGQDPSQPAVGDVRIQFTGVPAQTISVAAAQSGGTLTAFRDRNGYSIALAEPGVVPAMALFQDARHAEGELTWILRGAGFAGILVGFLLLASPVTTLFAVLPFMGSLVGAGAFLVALTLAIPTTLVVVGLAWVAHRPLVGGLLLAGGVLALILLKQLHPRRQAAGPA
jgi:hypothetical protein